MLFDANVLNHYCYHTEDITVLCSSHIKQEIILLALFPTISLPSKTKKTEASENTVAEPASKWCTN